jgi:hypothetical protein
VLLNTAIFFHFKFFIFSVLCVARRREDIYAEWGGGGGGSLQPRTAIEGSFSAWGGLGKLDRGLALGEPFFPDSDSYSDSDETFQISRKLGLVEFFCLLDSQPWKEV